MLLVLALPLSGSLRAQDAPSRPLRDPTSDVEPTPLPALSSTPPVTPQATPRPVEPPVREPAPSLTPEPSSTPTPTTIATPEGSVAAADQTPAKRTTRARGKSPRRTRQKTPANSTAEATPQATPAAQRDLQAVAAQLKEMEKQWEASFNDPAVIEKSVTDDFVGISPGGAIMTKRALLREAKENTSPPPKTTTRDMEVYFHGPAIAIVTGATKQIGTNRAGQTVEHNYRFTDTWVERDGQWRCFASHSILLPRH
jgi:ketosteroid isomerase-like protein